MSYQSTGGSKVSKIKEKTSLKNRGQKTAFEEKGDRRNSSVTVKHE